MSGHPDLGPLLQGGPTVDAAERAALLAHVAGCASCRQELTRSDPTRLFALLVLDPVPEFALACVSRGVSAALDAEGGQVPARRAAGLLALAASLLLAAVLGTVLGRGGRPAPGLARRDASAETAIPASMFEVLDATGTARVVRMDLRGQAELVMIFDKGLPL